MTLRSCLSGLAIFVTVLGQAPLAQAESDDVAALLLRAFELRREHHNEQALALYDQAFALSPSPSVRAQRALAHQSLGHWVEAERELDLALNGDDPWIARNRGSLEAAQAVVREHLAWLTVDVDVEGADIHLDGERLPQGTAARVVAGAAVLEVHAPGRVPDIRRVLLSPGEHVHREIALAALVAPLPPSDPDPVPPAPPPPSLLLQPRSLEPAAAPPRSVVPSASIVLGATGVAAIATGVYFGLRTSQDKANEETHCQGQCVAAAGHDYSDAQTSAAVSTVAFSVGAAALVGGAVFWFLDRRADRPVSQHVSVAPALGGGMRGLVLSGSL
ncbi:MAG TPA: hypothetical protein VGI39_07505 [Polyangiaceae bacterium]|jgi:serine/threonine-protein kinase